MNTEHKFCTKCSTLIYSSIQHSSPEQKLKQLLSIPLVKWEFGHLSAAIKKSKGEAVY